MRTVLGASLALFLSWVCAGFLRDRLKFPLTIWAPIWEEPLKNVIAWLFTGSLWGVHILFGLGEALYEWRQDNSSRLFLMNMLSHTLFGAVAVLLLHGGRWISGLGSMAIHFIWNIVILRISHQKNN